MEINEKHIKEKLESRTIAPSEILWEKLDQKLEKKRFHTTIVYYKYGIIASFAAGIILALFFYDFTQAQYQNIKVADLNITPVPSSFKKDDVQPNPKSNEIDNNFKPQVKTNSMVHSHTNEIPEVNNPVSIHNIENNTSTSPLTTPKIDIPQYTPEKEAKKLLNKAMKEEYYTNYSTSSTIISPETLLSNAEEKPIFEHRKTFIENSYVFLKTNFSKAKNKILANQ